MGPMIISFPLMVIDYIYTLIAFILWIKNLFINYKKNGSSIELYKERLKKAGVLSCIWISGINIPYLYFRLFHTNEITWLTIFCAIFSSIFLIKSIKDSYIQLLLSLVNI